MEAVRKIIAYDRVKQHITDSNKGRERERETDRQTQTDKDRQTETERQTESRVILFVSWCFEPSQPQRIILGLKTNLFPSPSFHSTSHKTFHIKFITLFQNISHKHYSITLHIYGLKRSLTKAVEQVTRLRLHEEKNQLKESINRFDSTYSVYTVGQCHTFSLRPYPNGTHKLSSP